MPTLWTQERVSFSFLKETPSFDKLHVCFPPLLMLKFYSIRAISNDCIKQRILLQRANC